MKEQITYSTFNPKKIRQKLEKIAKKTTFGEAGISAQTNNSYYAYQEGVEDGEVLLARKILSEWPTDHKESNKNLVSQLDHKTVLYRRLRDENRNPVGLLLAQNFDGVVYIGWSLCSEKDKFNFDKGYCLAQNRAYALYMNGVAEKTVHPEVIPDYNIFIDRVSRYFKGMKIVG